MTGLSNYTATGLLGHITGKQAIFPMRQTFVALFSQAGSDDGTGFTEIAGGAYARVGTAPADWNAPTVAAPSIINNANPIVFPTSTAAWGTILAFGLYDAATSGNLLAWDYFGAFAWLPVSIVAASPAVLTSPRHGYLNGDTVIYSTEYGGTPPTFSQGTMTGPLTVTSPLTDTFTVNSIGSVVVNTNTSGTGMVRKVGSQNIVANVQVTFPANSLVVSAA